MTTTHTAPVDINTGYPAATADIILAANTGDTIEFAYPGGPWGPWTEKLIVNKRSWAARPDLETWEFVELIDEGLLPETVVLTADGRAADRTWHDAITDTLVGAADIDDWVAYEVWSAKGRETHGYLHPTSRKIVQVG